MLFHTSGISEITRFLTGFLLFSMAFSKIALRNNNCILLCIYSLPVNYVQPITTYDIADLISLHRRELNRFITQKLGSLDAASDILQDAYLRLAGYESTETIANPRAFVFRIVSNLVIDYQRRSVNRIPHDTDEDILHAVPDAQSFPEQNIEAQQRLEMIDAALQELPEKCRLAFYLNRVEGYTHKEIAEQLQLSESMVAKHLLRAMCHCRERLKAYDPAS